ncbi:MAG TPA: hypothetical protein VIF34_11685 [Methylocystis sp.]
MQLSGIPSKAPVAAKMNRPDLKLRAARMDVSGGEPNPSRSCPAELKSCAGVGMSYPKRPAQLWEILRLVQLVRGLFQSRNGGDPQKHCGRQAAVACAFVEALVELGGFEPQTSDAELIEKLRYLLRIKPGYGADRALTNEYGLLAVAIDLHLNQGAASIRREHAERMMAA